MSAASLAIDTGDTIRAEIRALSLRLQRTEGDEPAWHFLYEVADELVEIATRAGRLGTVDSHPGWRRRRA